MLKLKLVSKSVNEVNTLREVSKIKRTNRPLVTSHRPERVQSSFFKRRF